MTPAKTLTFYLWDKSVIQFSRENGEFSVTVEHGQVFVLQAGIETGIPQTSFRYSEQEHEDEDNG
jgi:hypothetical protein